MTISERQCRRCGVLASEVRDQAEPICSENGLVASHVWTDVEVPSYRLTVTYAAGHDQAHEGLAAEQALTGAGAFLSDLLGLQGIGITRLVVEIEG